MNNNAKQNKAREHPHAKLWIAMSEHFLDTETRHTLIYSAGVCVQSGLSLDEIEDIFVHEVTPVLRFNLLSVAGEWAGFDEDWLCAACVKHAREQNLCSPLRRITSSAFNARFAANERKTLLALCELFAPLEIEEQTLLSKQLSAMAQVFFDFVPPKTCVAFRPCASLFSYQELFFTRFVPIFRPVFYDEQEKGRARVLKWLKSER